MTCGGVDGLAGLTVVANGFKGVQAADEPRPYKPVLEYLVIDRRARGTGLGRQLARHVLNEAARGADGVTVEVEHERVDAVRFWTRHMQCTVLPDSE
ncbi:GNAT family N-acetyltransferase [Streptomyces zhihengii]|uniref:GNAT family N-acetyltransferase n=1 Tax=Streptomyces zhihengii TaxID=1818004 RepID=UPI003634A769